MGQKKSYEERLFGAACLLVTLQKKSGENAAGLEIYRATLNDLDISEAEVDAFLEKNRGPVELALEKSRSKKLS